MADGILPMNGPQCVHGLRLPSAVAMIVAARKLYEGDWATAVAIAVDWCDVCHSPAIQAKEKENA